MRALVQRDLRRQAVGHVRVVGILAAGVDDQIEHAVAIRRLRPRDHQVIENAAIGCEELRVALLAMFQVQHVGGNQRFERVGNGVVAEILGDDVGLPHVRDIEQSGLLARVQMFLQHAERILHGHLVARERHHLGAKRDVQVVERGPLERDGRRRAWGCGGSHANDPVRASTPDAECVQVKPPLSRDLRDLSDARTARALPLRWTAVAVAFQSACPSAVHLPERFRGGCSFGAGRSPLDEAHSRSLPQTGLGTPYLSRGDAPVNGFRLMRKTALWEMLKQAC